MKEVTFLLDLEKWCIRNCIGLAEQKELENILIRSIKIQENLNDGTRNIS